jgi:hypothetical protein
MNESYVILEKAEKNSIFETRSIFLAGIKD